MSAIHMAALYGQVEAVRELLNHIPSHMKSAYPASEVTCVVKELKISNSFGHFTFFTAFEEKIDHQTPNIISDVFSFSGQVISIVDST